MARIQVIKQHTKKHNGKMVVGSVLTGNHLCSIFEGTADSQSGNICKLDRDESTLLDNPDLILSLFDKLF